MPIERLALAGKPLAPILGKNAARDNFAAMRMVNLEMPAYSAMVCFRSRMLVANFRFAEFRHVIPAPSASAYKDFSFSRGISFPHQPWRNPRRRFGEYLPV
jgi:hypothetical protein